MSRKTRKLMWSVPLVAAVAVIGALAAFMTLTPGSIFADDLADAPQNLEVEAADGSAGRTTLVLTWEAPESGAPDMYRIDRSSDNDKWKYLTSVSGDMLTHTDDTVGGKFETGNTRYYRVFAMDSEHGSGAVSTSESATTDPITTPHQVKPFDADASGPEANELTWTAPDDGGSEILGYCIRAWPTGTTAATITAISEENCKDDFFEDGPGGSAGMYRDSDGTTNNQPGGIIRILPATSYMHKGRNAKEEWSYQIYALNEHGHSEVVSATREATTAEANDPPKPGNFLVRQVDATTDEIVHLYWTISGDGGQDIVAYRVEVSDTANQWPDEGTALPSPLAGDRASGAALALKDAADTDGPMVVVIGVNPDQPTGGAVSYDLRHTFPDGAITEDGTYYYRVRVETLSSAGNNRKMSAYTMGSVDLTAISADEDYMHGDKNPSAPVLGPDGVDTTATPPTPTAHTGTADNATDDDVTPGEVTLTVVKSTLGGSDSYRVDISDDGGETWSMVHSSTRPINQTEYEHQGLKPNQLRSFRIFTKKGSAYGVASNVAMDYSAHSHEPGEVRDLTATADGAGKINLTWNAPENDGGAMIDKYCIIAEKVNDNDPRGVIGDDFMRSDDAGTNEIRVVADSVPNAANCARFSLPKKATIKLTANGIYDVAASTTSVMFTGLDQESRWQFEVYGLNGATVAGTPAGTPDILKGVAQESETEDAKTTEAMVPGAPKNLTAELARDTNFSGVGNRGVLVLWNAPSDPAGAPVVGYKIERKVDDGEYEEKISSRDAGMTHWVDTDEPAEGEMRTYRITSINAVGVGTETATVMIPHPGEHSHIMVSDAPTGLSATAVSDTQIDLSWDAPASDGGSAVTHYIIERRYTGDMMGDLVPSDYAPGGASFAFTNHMDWWETLNCDGMVAVFGGTRDDAADVAMYCGHYANTAPSNLAEGTIMAGDDLDVKIEALFNKRYVITDDTTRTYSDEGLMPDTEYRYRVSAVNGEGRSSWSAADTATTEMTPVELTAPTILQTNPVGSGIVLVSWTSVDSATGYSLIAVNLTDPDAPTRTGEAVATATSGQVQNLIGGDEYLIFVAAFNADLDFELSDYVRVTADREQ